MTDIPKFKLFGEDDPDVQAVLRPDRGYRDWNDLNGEHKEIIFRELDRKNIFHPRGRELVRTIEYLNHEHLEICPGKYLHKISRGSNGRYDERAILLAAYNDFKYILKNEKSSEIVMLMFSKFVQCFINETSLGFANTLDDIKRKKEIIDEAYERFDSVSGHFNHIFEQFSINQEVTRNGFIPRQDKKITELIYQPTLKILSDPKWQSVDSDFSRMFDDFQNAKYSECIAKAHNAVQRFLQVIIGEEGKNGKGNFGQLFSEAKKNGLISVNQFTEPVINAMQRYIPSERANNSSAKPAVKEATYSDALLMMNVVMVLIQHCLQNLNDGTNYV